MRPTQLTAAFALTLAAGAASAQQPTAPPTTPTMPASPAQPDSGAMRDSAMRGMPRAGMMQDSMARRGAMRDSMGGMVMRHDTSAGDTTLSAKLDSVDVAAKSGLTALPVAVALPLLEGIETRLRATGRPTLLSIATDLGALRRELGMSTVNRVRVGTILRRVGPKVTTAATGQSGMLRTTLRDIGGQLTSAGRQLSAPR